ncbi:MAG: DUF4982 domain-containing protein [Alistipes sp.]|nr:DUF4982 domain-containing protein [Alistipes sp.]
MKRFLLTACAMMATLLLSAQPLRTEQELKTWEFRRDHNLTATEGWQQVSVPHDWAIYGPFSREHDLQRVAVEQNGEKVATEKTGRTGGLPYMGKGAYRTSLSIAKGDTSRYILLFDGAMSEAQVFVNGQKVGYWPYGYNSFYCDATEAVKEGENRIEVLLENKPQSSRWYPGAGLYRKVRLMTLPAMHIPVWGTQITTPYVGKEYASVTLKTEVKGVAEKQAVTLHTVIRDAEGKVVSEKRDTRNIFYGMPFEQHLTIDNPKLWSPETPNLYTAHTTLYDGERAVDQYTTRFGVRTIELRADKGFFLNGELRKFKGVCLHHDLGPLGAAINKAAIRRQLTILKDMGCDAIRTSHNMPAEELVELCDEMGFMMQLEPFDEWDVAKCENGYHRFFQEWAEKDMVNMLRHYRNNASVVMWSVGNEVPTQRTRSGYKVASWLQSICHREDPTRPVTCGMDQFPRVLENGFAAQFDVAGFNYRVHFYERGYETLPQNLILGSETTSTVSSRGVYQFPVEERKGAIYPDHHSSAYDVECCSWSNLPDLDFAVNDDFPWLIGQFVWTGFDYLGEPSPYDTDAWPNHSSMFGIVDLASIPKDRYWLYRSIWNTEAETLHILPHWNWKGREGEVTPIFVYTSYPEAELFINGKSQGRRVKSKASNMERYRLMWKEVKYEPGEVRVVAYDKAGNVAAEKRIVTSGKGYQLHVEADRTVLDKSGEDLAYLTVSVVDKQGNPVPTESRSVKVDVKGKGTFRAMANGDPTSLELFHLPEMKLFSGKLTAIVQSGTEAGDVEVTVSAKGLKPATIRLSVE